MTCSWLPKFYDTPDWNKYSEYENNLYILFKEMYLNSRIYFLEVIVRYRLNPKFNNREEIFYHLTCKNYNNDNTREPDKERIIRIKWAKAYIENYLCDNTCCQNKPLYWNKEYGRNTRHKIFHNDYLVILEERENYFLLVTAYYVDEEYYKRGLIKEYQKFLEKTKSAANATQSESPTTHGS